MSDTNCLVLSSSISSWSGAGNLSKDTNQVGTCHHYTEFILYDHFLLWLAHQVFSFSTFSDLVLLLLSVLLSRSCLYVQHLSTSDLVFLSFGVVHSLPSPKFMPVSLVNNLR